MGMTVTLITALTSLVVAVTGLVAALRKPSEPRVKEISHDVARELVSESSEHAGP